MIPRWLSFPWRHQTKPYITRKALDSILIAMTVVIGVTLGIRVALGIYWGMPRAVPGPGPAQRSVPAPGSPPPPPSPAPALALPVTAAGGRRCPLTCEIDRELRLKEPPLQGYDVVECQVRLAQLKFYKGKIDGIYGPETAKAVKRFQRWAKIRADGVVRDEVWDKMGEGIYREVSHAPTPAPPGEVWLLVDVDRLVLTVYSDDRPYKNYPIAIGKWDTPTQLGEFRIIDKGYNPGGPFGTRWMGLNVPWGAYGIHGTNRPWSIGSPASAGCIRMFNPDVEELFDWVFIGTRVVITGRNLAEELPTEFTRVLRQGDTGQDVQAVQFRLRNMGFDPGPLDGWFGEGMLRAVKRLERFYGLPERGEVGPNELCVLGLR